MSSKLKKTVKEKIHDIEDQRDIFVAFINEYVSEAKLEADRLLSMQDTGQFMQNYVDVMQNLDRCYNTFVLLSAEAEEKIESLRNLWTHSQEMSSRQQHSQIETRSQERSSKYEQDSQSETKHSGINKSETENGKASTTSWNIHESPATKEISKDKHHLHNRVERKVVQTSSAKNEGRELIHFSQCKTEQEETPTNLALRTVEVSSRNEVEYERKSAILDQGSFKQDNPSEVKDRLVFLSDGSDDVVQGMATALISEEGKQINTITDTRGKSDEFADDFDQSRCTDIIHESDLRSPVLQRSTLMDSQHNFSCNKSTVMDTSDAICRGASYVEPEIVTSKGTVRENTEFVKEEYRDVNLNKSETKPQFEKGVSNIIDMQDGKQEEEKYSGISSESNYPKEKIENLKSQPGSLTEMESALELPSDDFDPTLSRAGSVGQPKLDMTVARRFLHSIIKQANEDNLKIENEKKACNSTREEQRIQPNYTWGEDEESRLSIRTSATSCPGDKETVGQEKIVIKDADENSDSYKHRELKTDNVKTITKSDPSVAKSSNDPGVDQSVAQSSNDVQTTNDEQSSVKCQDVEDHHLIDQSKTPDVGKSTSKQNLTDNKDSVLKNVECDVRLETNIDKSDRVPSDKSDEAASLSEEGSGYGRGPQLVREMLEEKRIHTVIVSESITPWSFYVQKYTTDLIDMMKRLNTFITQESESLNCILHPIKGMICLAQFSQDMIFYRARVEKIFSVGKDVSVDVLFVDYGNGEKRKLSHLRELPKQFAELPTQAIHCALSHVAPVNKHGIWTEDNITSFSQFVSGQKFSCMPASLTTSQQTLVTLFFNLPEPVLKDGQVVFQPSQNQISVHEVLHRKGQAKDITIDDQLKLLRGPSSEQHLKSTQESKQPKNSTENEVNVDKEKTGEKGEHSCQKSGNVLYHESSQKSENVLPQESLEKSENLLHQEGHAVLHSESSENETSKQIVVQKSEDSETDGVLLPRLPKSATRDSTESKTKLRKHEKERKLSKSKHQAKPSPETKTNDSNKSKDIKPDKSSHHDKTLSEGTDLEPMCSTPVSSDHNNLNLQEISNRTDKNGNLTVQNITEIKIRNDSKAEDLNIDNTSLKSVESGSVHYSVDNSVDLQSKLDVQIQGLKVMLSHVKSPSDFYVHLVSETCAETLDKMHKSLNKTMEQTTKKSLQKLAKSFYPVVGELCCVLFSEDNQYYRGLVTQTETSVKQSNKQESDPQNIEKVHIFYLDFGNSEVVSRQKVFPLPSQYSEIPGLAIHVCLAYIKPVKSSSKEKAVWTEEMTDKFVSLTGFEMVFDMIIVQGDITELLENPPFIAVKKPVLQILLVSSCQDEEEVCVNMDLIRLGIARLSAGDTTSKQESSPDKKLSEWDPMSEDYLDYRNCYNIDVDDAGVATTGIKVRDDQKICKYYQKNSCWRGERCLYRHTIVSPGALTGDTDYVYAGDMEEYHQDDLPDPGTWVACEVSTIINPAHFYIVLPFGKQPLESLNKGKKEEGYSSFQHETLEDMMASLQEYYNSKRFEASYVDYAPGEVVVARYGADLQWYRARVISSGDREVEVFYVDFGNKETVDDMSIRKIDPQFLHLPFQALECFLVNLEPLGGTDKFDKEAKFAFRKLVDGKTLVAYIKSRSWSGCAWVELFDTSGEEDVSISRAMIDKGLAQESTSLSSTTSGLASQTSSRASSQESLVLMPG